MTTTAMDPMQARQTRGRRVLLGIAALFLVPLAIAFFLYYGTSWRPVGSTNHGELLSPVRVVPEFSLPRLDGTRADRALVQEKWSLVYVADGACGSDCRASLHTSRQTRLALRQERDRVQRIFLATTSCCDREFLDREHRGLVTLDARGDDARALLATFATQDPAHSLWVVDPRGNVILRFDARENPKGLLTDLKKLLTLSHIG